MRKIITAIALIAAATPAVAHETVNHQTYYDTYNHRWVDPEYEEARANYENGYRDGYRERDYRNDYYDYRNPNYYDNNRNYRRRGTDDVIVPLIVGGIIGAIISGAHHKRHRDHRDH